MLYLYLKKKKEKEKGLKKKKPIRKQIPKSDSKTVPSIYLLFGSWQLFKRKEIKILDLIFLK